MNRRTFVTKTAAVTLGLSIPAFATAKTSFSLPMEEEQMLNDFQQLLASYSFGEGFNNSLTTIRRINPSAPGLLDFQDANGNRISLRKVKGRLVARLH